MVANAERSGTPPPLIREAEGLLAKPTLDVPLSQDQIQQGYITIVGTKTRLPVTG